MDIISLKPKNIKKIDLIYLLIKQFLLSFEVFSFLFDFAKHKFTICLISLPKLDLRNKAKSGNKGLNAVKMQF